MQFGETVYHVFCKFSEFRFNRQWKKSNQKAESFTIPDFNVWTENKHKNKNIDL